MNGMYRRRTLRATGIGLLVWICVTSASAVGREEAAAIHVDTSALQSLGHADREENPYRGDAKAIEIGALAFELACSRCHVLGNVGGIGPDLRNLNVACRKIADTAMRQACLRDQDYYFLKTVREGKTIVGVTHMPAWRDYLTQEAIWAIRSFIESRATDK